MDTIDLGREVDTINEARKTQGMTIRELSDASGVPLATVQRILSHTAKNPSHQAIGSLQAALGLTQPEDPGPDLEILSVAGIPAPDPFDQTEGYIGDLLVTHFQLKVIGHPTENMDFCHTTPFCREGNTYI